MHNHYTFITKCVSWECVNHITSLSCKRYLHPKTYAHGALCFLCGLIQAFFSHILQGCFTRIGAIVWLPQFGWSNPEGYGKIDPIIPLGTYQITTIKQSLMKPFTYFMGYTRSTFIYHTIDTPGYPYHAEQICFWYKINTQLTTWAGYYKKKVFTHSIPTCHLEKMEFWTGIMFLKLPVK